jgi:hypothetical protein
MFDPNAGHAYVERGQRRRPPDRGPGGSGGPSGRGGGGGGGGGPRIVGFGEMKDMGPPRECRRAGGGRPHGAMPVGRKGLQLQARCGRGRP